MKKYFLSTGKLSINNLIAFINAFLIRLSNVTFFKTPDVEKQAATVQDMVNNLEAANNEDSTRRSTHVKLMHERLSQEISILVGLMETLLYRSAKEESERTALATDAGLQVKNKRNIVPRTFGAKPGSTPDSVKLKAKGRAQVHQWQYTSDIDKFTNCIMLEPTTVATIEISNLKRGTYAFFHKAQVKGTTSAWEGPVYFVVAENADQIA